MQDFSVNFYILFRNINKVACLINIKCSLTKKAKNAYYSTSKNFFSLTNENYSTCAKLLVIKNIQACRAIIYKSNPLY